MDYERREIKQIDPLEMGQSDDFAKRLELLKQSCISREQFLGLDNQKNCLISILISKEHDMRVDYRIKYERLYEFCKVKENKQELIDVLKTLVDKVEDDYGFSEGVKNV